MILVLPDFNSKKANDCIKILKTKYLLSDALIEYLFFTTGLT